MASTLQALGNLAHQVGDTAGAHQYYGQALDIRQKLAPGSMLEAESLAALAAVLRDAHKPDAAVQFYEQAVNALEKQSARLGGSEEVRSGFRASHSDIYRDYVDLLLAQKQSARAFEVSEQSRARILLEVLTAAHLDIRKGADPSLLQQERSLRKSISAKSERRLRFIGEKDNEKQFAAFTHEIEELERQYQEVEDRLRQNSPIYAALTQPQPLTSGEIQQLLGPDTLLLEYSLGEKRSHVFAVTRESITAQELPKRAEIEKLAKRTLDLLTARRQGHAGMAQTQREYRQVVAALSRMLLDPVSANLSGKRLAVVADGALQYIPFAILPAPASAGTRSSVPLILDHEIVNLPSASLLAVLRQQAQGRTAPPKAVAVLADPVFSQADSRVIADKGGQALIPAAAVAPPEDADRTVSGSSSPDTEDLTRSAAELGISANGSEFPRLRFSRTEAESIVSLTPQGSSMEALDFQASRETAASPQLAQYRVVHLATHGLINNLHPELSGLVFSLVDQHGKPENGFLELEDIYNLNLPVDLVVLSACESGLGKEIQGEGLIGLTRGFMHAGASRVIASLWNVSDVATAALMKEFYRGLEKDGMTPAAALRQAQIWMWKQPEWRFPYYWAAFQLQGDWK